VADRDGAVWWCADDDYTLYYNMHDVLAERRFYLVILFHSIAQNT